MGLVSVNILDMLCMLIIGYLPLLLLVLTNHEIMKIGINFKVFVRKIQAGKIFKIRKQNHKI